MAPMSRKASHCRPPRSGAADCGRPGPGQLPVPYRPAAWPAACSSHVRPQDPRGVMARGGLGPARTGRGLPAVLHRMAGSSERPAWKQELPDRLVQAQVPAVRSGLAAMELSLMAGPARHWANLWKPLIDAFGSVLGEVLLRAFQPNHDRIVRLGLQHHVTSGIGHDVTIDPADDAVRHALAAGDPAWSARLVERHVETLLGRSEGATLQAGPHPDAPARRQGPRPTRTGEPVRVAAGTLARTEPPGIGRPWSSPGAEKILTACNDCKAAPWPEADCLA